VGVPFSLYHPESQKCFVWRKKKKTGGRGERKKKKKKDAVIRLRNSNFQLGGGPVDPHERKKKKGMAVLLGTKARGVAFLQKKKKKPRRQYSPTAEIKELG